MDRILCCPENAEGIKCDCETRDLKRSVAEAQDLYVSCKAKLDKAEEALQEINLYWYKLHNSPWQNGKTCEAKIASALKKFFKQ